MARVKRSVHSKKHRRSTLKKAKGYYGNKSRSFRSAKEQVQHSGAYAFRDRRAKKGQFRRLWIQRINAACRQNGTNYSRFIAGLKHAEVDVDRKSADLQADEMRSLKQVNRLRALVTMEQRTPADSPGPDVAGGIDRHGECGGRVGREQEDQETEG